MCLMDMHRPDRVIVNETTEYKYAAMQILYSIII